MKNIILLIFVVLCFTSCGNIQDKVRNTVQTESAKQIRGDYKEIIKLLSLYKTKLDKRNPQSHNLMLDRLVKDDIYNNTNTINLRIQNSSNYPKYTDYLNYAFNKDMVLKDRNDYLIIGLYKMFYSAYKMDLKHKLTALSYEVEDLQKAYKNLQVIQWKIKNDKNKNNQYLFLTWQNNWQIELSKRLEKSSLDNISLGQLENIKSKKESLLDPSNHSFEIITSKMILYLAHSIKVLDGEPEDLGINAILSFIFFL
ncbi:MAG: hypothetical protein WBG69_09155 [Arcobacteraceae bacterium]